MRLRPVRGSWRTAERPGWIQRSKKRATQRRSEGKGALVLVVDDLEDMRTLIGKALKRRGYRVLKAANGEQGYEVICDRKPDLSSPIG